MFHCPKCHKLIKNGTQFCPYCGYHVSYSRPQAQTYRPAKPVQSTYYPPKRDHGCAYGCFTFLAIIVILILGAFYFTSTPKGHQTIQQTVSNVTHHGIHNHSKHVSVDVSTGKPKHQSLVNKVLHHNSDNAMDHNMPGYTPTIMPTNIRGTWYSYDNGKLDTLTITKNSYKETEMPYAITLHPRSKKSKADPMKMAIHKTWGVANYAHVRGLNFIEIRGWNQGAGDGVSFAEFDHKGTITLDMAGGAGFSTDANYFRTKGLAKLFKKKVFKDAGEISDN